MSIHGFMQPEGVVITAHVYQAHVSHDHIYFKYIFKTKTLSKTEINENVALNIGTHDLWSVFLLLLFF